MEGDAASLVAQYESLVGRRHNWDNLWQDVKELVWPHGGDFTVTTTPGERRAARQYEMTNALALEKFGAVLESLLTPRQQRFHFLKPSLHELESDREAALYFEKLNNLLFRMRGRPVSGFYDQMHEGWKSHGAFGNMCMNVEPLRIAGGGLNYRQIHVGAVWIEVNDRGIVDTVFYKFRLSAKASLDRWGQERVPACVRDKIKQGKEYDQLDFLHVIKPRRKVDPQAIGPEAMPWESYEISLKEKEFIPWQPFEGGPLMAAGGYWTNPYVYSRWGTNPSEILGRGPAMIVLADNSQLQEMERSTTLAGQIAAEPPIMTMDDNLFGEATTELDLRPSALNGGWLDAQGNPKAKPFVSGFQYPLTKELMDQKREIINDAHFITLFQILVQTPEMTATEALLRAQEKGMLIAPVVGRQQSENLGRVIEREIDLLDQQGLMPQAPGVLIEAQGEYEIEYSSMATRLQREEEVQGILATYADLTMLREADDTVVEVLDAVDAARFIAKARGVPDHIVRDERAFNERLSQMAEAAEKQQAAQALPMLAAAAKDASAAGIDVEALADQAAAAA